MFLMLTPFIKRCFGIFFIIFLSWLISADRKKINCMQIMKMLLSMIFLAWALLKTTIGLKSIAIIASGVESLYKAAGVGINFLFGELVNENSAVGFVFAFKVLPIIIFFASLMSMLYYLGVIQFIVEKIGNAVRPIFGTSGPETLCAVANSFLGQTESPLLIKSYLKDMTRSEIFVVMVSGMGTISAGIMAIYGSLGIPIKHLLVSSVISIPATVLIAKLWIPETKKIVDSKASAAKNSNYKSLFEAIFGGASEGMYLAFNVGCSLLVTLTFIYLINNFLFFFSIFVNKVLGLHLILTLENILALMALPATWILGIPSDEVNIAANLIGTKIAINEMIAFSSMSSLPLTYGTVAILTYALCGFSNFSCIGIQIGGIGTLEPSIKGTLSELGFKAVFAAALANLLSACVAGLFI